MKNANELRIPAYAVIDVMDGVVVTLNHTRQDARTTLQDVKRYHKDDKSKIIKILKLKADNLFVKSCGITHSVL